MKRMRIAMVMASLLALAGCQDSGLDLSAQSAPRVTVGASLPVTVQQIDGLPQELSPRFSAALASEAQAREIVFVDASQSPRFKIRGYLNAHQGEGGVTATWVWDVFDTRHNRAQRISGQQPLGRSASDPWSVVDDTVLRFVAARSLDGIGGFLVENRGSAAPVASATGGTGRETARGTSGD
jgi:hypothetical protein